MTAGDPTGPRPPSRDRPQPFSGATWRRRTGVTAALAVIAASVWAYHRQIGQPFVIDDWHYLAAAQSGSWRHVVTSPAASVYRPVLDLWFLAGQELAGVHATAFEAAAFLVLLVNATLLALLVRKWQVSWFGAGVAAALYALHPALTGTVGWVAASNALLVATFALLACTTLADAEPTLRARALAPLWMLLALLTREDAIVLAVAIPVLRFTLPGMRELRLVERIKKAVVPAVPLIAAAALYGIVRLGAGASTRGTSYQTGVGANVVHNAVRLAEYLAVVPMIPRDTLLNSRLWEAVGVGFVAGAALVAVLIWRRQPLAVAGIVFGALGVVPALLVQRHAMEPYYLDLAVPGLALAAAAVADEAATKRRRCYDDGGHGRRRSPR